MHMKWRPESCAVAPRVTRLRTLRAGALGAMIETTRRARVAWASLRRSAGAFSVLGGTSRSPPQGSGPAGDLGFVPCELCKRESMPRDA